jgi:hypothetical protein
MRFARDYCGARPGRGSVGRRDAGGLTQWNQRASSAFYWPKS